MRITAISIVTMSLALASVATAAAALSTPAELLAAAPAPGGFELATDELRSQDYDEFAGSSPYSVGHVQNGSNEADQLLAGQDVWSLGDEDTLLREVARWSSADVADLYRREVAAYAAGDALAEVESPFEGARAFSGSDPVTDVWVRIVVWTDGPFGAAVTHFTPGGDPSSAIVDAAARSLADAIESSGASPAANDDSTGDEGADDAAGGGGIPLTTVLLFVAVVGGGIWLFLRMRKRLAAARSTANEPTPPPRDDRTDERTDDIVDEARRKAREEVERTSDQWQVPDDY